MALDEKRAAEIAELEVRRYFDHYLEDIFPKQVEALEEHSRCLVEKHNLHPKAHGAIETRFNRMFWVVVGAATASGLGAGTAIGGVLRAIGH